MGAIAIATFATALDSFRRGRDLASYLGFVSRQSSTSGKQILGGPVVGRCYFHLPSGKRDLETEGSLTKTAWPPPPPLARCPRG